MDGSAVQGPGRPKICCALQIAPALRRVLSPGSSGVEGGIAPFGDLCSWCLLCQCKPASCGLLDFLQNTPARLCCPLCFPLCRPSLASLVMGWLCRSASVQLNLPFSRLVCGFRAPPFLAGSRESDVCCGLELAGVSILSSD